MKNFCASDGHVAFNPPGTERSARTRIVRIADKTRNDNLGTFPDFKGIDEVPTHGVSVGPATMVDVSAIVIMQLIGEHKAQAFQRISAATNYQSDWPSTIVRECKNYYILADKAAAKI
jgi:glucosamine-6-phosphate deaminase